MLKLNLGAGHTQIPGFTPVDRKFGTEVYPLAYPDNSADEIRASHVLEHVSHKDCEKVLREWLRVLKPGGWLKIAVPDLDFAIVHREHPHWIKWIMGGHGDKNDLHLNLFTVPILQKTLEAVGLQEIQTWESEIQDCAALPVSLNLKGRKPLVAAKPTEGASPPVPKAAFALSMPRLGFNDSWGCLSSVASYWQFPIRRVTGVWWERCLQTTLEDLIEEGYELAITVDYDSLFTFPQFNSLLDTLLRNPHMDAVCAMQPQRGSGMVMCKPSEAGPDNVVNVDGGQPLKVDTGHFGLTILRLNKLKDIPKPWFLNVPGKDGSWRREAPGLIDADIYFWQQWKASGCSLYMLPWVSIGHLECLVSRIDPATGKSMHIHAKDWMKQAFDKAVQVQREAKP